MYEGGSIWCRSVVTDEYLCVKGSNGSIFAMGDAATVEQARALSRAKVSTPVVSSLPSLSVCCLCACPPDCLCLRLFVSFFAYLSVSLSVTALRPTSAVIPAQDLHILHDVKHCNVPSVTLVALAS